MNIFVCFKCVPDTETRIKLLPDNSNIDPAGIKWIINPYDMFALEEALKLKGTATDKTIRVLSVGPKDRLRESFVTALAMGADEAVCLDAPFELDNFSTAAALAEYFKKTPYDVILTGSLAIDDNSLATTQVLAELLNTGHVTLACKAEWSTGKVLVERESEGGSKEKVEVTLPSVIGVTKGINTPRYVSLPGIMKAKKKTIQEISVSTLGVTADHLKTRVGSFSLPPDRPPVKVLSGDLPAQCKSLVDLLKNEAKIL